MSDGAPSRVVIIDPAYLGDAVFDAALAREVKRRWPEVEVGLVLRPPADRLAAFMPFVDVVHRFDKRGQDRGLRGLRRLAAQLADRGYDLALIPHPSIRSTWLAARAGIPRRLGDAPGWLARRPLTERRAPSTGAGFVQSRLRILGAPDGHPELEGAMSASPRAAGSDRRRIGLVLGSEWATKRWPPQHAAAWVGQLDPERDEVVLLGAPNERELYDAILSQPARGVRIEDAVGEPLEDLVPRIASCDVLVAGDTGPLHIARALGVPVVALFGPTDPGRHVAGPRDRVLTVRLDCRPCSAHGGHVCPEQHHRCLEDLGPKTVAAAVHDVLEVRP